MRRQRPVNQVAISPRWVYALVDPRTTAIHYVGCCKHLKQRTGAHTNGRLPPKQPRLARWLEELRAAGLKPEFCLLAEIRFTKDWLWSNSAARAVEKDAIRWYGLRHPLTNVVGMAKHDESRPHHPGVAFNGRKQSIAAWARELGITREGLRQRLLVYPIAVALTTPKGVKPKT